MAAARLMRRPLRVAGSRACGSYSFGCSRGVALAGLQRPHGRCLSSASQGSPEPLDPILPEAGKPSLWTRFVKFSYRYLGSSVYPAKADICNCGLDVGVQIPQPELVKREGIEFNSREWRMQVYGAALYWYMATMPTAFMRDQDPDMLRGKDILEVAAMRGGGARYLAEVTGPRRYVATDNVQEHVDLARKLHLPCEGLEFELADAHDLASAFPAESFDFVLCIQAAATFGDLRQFIGGANHVLRPGGRILMADALTRNKLKSILEAAEEFGLLIEIENDISRGVHAVGLCQVPWGLSYVRFVLLKQA